MLHTSAHAHMHNTAPCWLCQLVSFGCQKISFPALPVSGVDAFYHLARPYSQDTGISPTYSCIAIKKLCYTWLPFLRGGGFVNASAALLGRFSLLG